MKRESLVQLPAALGAPASARAERYVLGIDGGATKTVAGVLDLDSCELHVAEGGPSNEDAVGVDAAVGSLLAVADEALERAGVGDRELARAVIAVAGVDTEAMAGRVRAARSEDWIVVNDVIGAWAAATGGRPGVGAIAGTGSNVFGVGEGGRSWRVGGWGHLLGDEGSGYWLGIKSIHAALADRDGSGPETALSAAAEDFFGVDSVEALAPLVYSKPLSKSEIAAFAVKTCALAEQGDAVARELYRRGAAELAGQILTVIRRTGLGEAGANGARARGGGDSGGGVEDGSFPVGLIGSVFRAGAVFVEPLIEAVRESAPAARVAVVEMAPVGGSLQLAARACGRPSAIERGDLERSLHGALQARR
jgi:glucosamine kinase